MQIFSVDHIVYKNTLMNQLIPQLPIDKALNNAEFQIFFKGIWTGVLISLIVHYFANH